MVGHCLLLYSSIAFVKMPFDAIKGKELQGFLGNFVSSTLVRKIYCIERPIDRFSPTADSKAKGDFVDSNVKPQQWLVA